MNFFLNILLLISITILGISCSNSSSKNIKKVIETNTIQNLEASVSNSSSKDVEKVTETKTIQNLEASVFATKLSESNGILLDVRTEEEINQGYIQGASFINFYDENFNQKINYIQKDKPVFVYCKMGGRSAKAAEKLFSIGFKEVYNLSGGIQSWYNNGYSIEQDSIVNPITQEFSIEQFNEMLNSTNVPTVICFQTKWCLPCKQMNPILSEISNSLKSDVIFLKIDLDNNLEIAKQFNIESVPTFVGMLNKTELWRQVGFVEKTHLLNMILSIK